MSSPPERARAYLGAMLAGSRSSAEKLAFELLDAKAPSISKRDVRYLLFVAGGEEARKHIAREAFSELGDCGIELAKDLANTYDLDHSLILRLSEDELSLIYSWLERMGLTNEKHTDASGSRLEAQDRERISDMGDALIRHLGSRATPAAIDALGRLSDEFPALSFLPRLKRRAQEMLALHSWLPPTIDELLALARDRAKRYVETSEELRVVVVESLRRFQKELNESETPASEFLWNYCAKEKPERQFVPKMKPHSVI